MISQQNESEYTMSYSMSEAQRLERWSTIFDTLMERDLIEHSRESDKLLEDWNNLNTRIEMNRTRLALLKSSSELTEEEKKRRPGPGGSERFNIKY